MCTVPSHITSPPISKKNWQSFIFTCSYSQRCAYTWSWSCVFIPRIWISREDGRGERRTAVCSSERSSHVAVRLISQAPPNSSAMSSRSRPFRLPFFLLVFFLFAHTVLATTLDTLALGAARHDGPANALSRGWRQPAVLTGALRSRLSLKYRRQSSAGGSVVQFTYTTTVQSLTASLLSLLSSLLYVPS